MRLRGSFFENELVTIEIIDGIEHFTLKNIIVSKQEAIKLVKDRIEFQNGITYPIICDIQQAIYINNEAREYFANEGAALASACAVVISSHVSHILANFFMLFNKPPVPTRIFNNKESAVTWLKRFREVG
ncbi:MAG: hypothetical protein ACK40G_02330 [Cytophagaceae bacterium]